MAEKIVASVWLLLSLFSLVSFMKIILARNKFSFWCYWTKNNNYTQLRGCIRSVSYYERYLSAPIEITVTLTSVEMNQRMLKIINFSDGYKVTTNAFSMLLMVCWNRLTVCWNRLTLTNGLLTADWRWLTANWRFRPLNVKTLVYVFPCEVAFSFVKCLQERNKLFYSELGSNFIVIIT